MRRLVTSGCALLVIGGAAVRAAKGPAPPSAASPRSMIQYDSIVATREPGPHNGGGETTAYSFFKGEPGEDLVILISYQQAIR